jgi:glycosyltransferase involved in cell wall biosynthesis
MESLVQDLGLTGEVQLHGFAANPYQWLTRSSLFVLSSRWEGSPNALTEALALGIPVVSTDCRSGPREILQDGRYGSLVRMGKGYLKTLGLNEQKG